MDLLLPIRAVEHASPRARILRLDLAGQPFRYRAGQVALLGRPSQPVRRPYSFASAPQEAAETGALHFLVSVDENGTGGSHLGSLVPGAKLALQGPLGSFVLPDAIAERQLLFVAGGTGIAPVRALLSDALRRDGSLEASVLYTARTSDDFAFEGELRALADAGRIRLHQTVTRETGHGWAGPRGRIDRARLAPLITNAETLCFVCGPHGLVQDVPRLLAELGIGPQRIRVEEWGG